MLASELNIPAPPSKVDFLIVGGGPVGLLAANLIVQAGLTVRILGKFLFIYYYSSYPKQS